MQPRLNTYLLGSLLTLILSACAGSKSDEALVYSVSYSNFENVIPVDGFVEPVSSTTIVCPPRTDGIILSIKEDGTFVNEGDIVCVLEDLDLNGEYDRGVIALENAQATLNKTRADLEMQYTILAAQNQINLTDMKIAQMDSLQLIYAPPNQRRIMELELDISKITKAKFDKKLEALDIIQQSEIRRWEMEIKQLQDRVLSMRQRMDALTVKAPKSGLMIRAQSWMTGNKLKEGDNVWNNMPIGTIPNVSKMKVKILTSERDFKQINVNDSVNYAFDAMPGNVASGRIVSKMPVGQPIKQGSKVKVFEIEASIDSMIEMPEPGFTADCRVVSERIKNVLILPQIAIFEQDSMKVTHVKHKRGYELRQVLTGLSSLREIIVTDGLKEGEIVLLTKPLPSLIKKRTLLPPKPRRRINSDTINDSIFKYMPLWELKPSETPVSLPSSF